MATRWPRSPTSGSPDLRCFRIVSFGRRGRGFRPSRRRHRGLPGRQHHGRADLRQDRRELHPAPLPRPQGPFPQRRMGRRHGGRRAQAAGARRLRARSHRPDRRLRRQRHRLGDEGRRGAQEALPRLDPGHRRSLQGTRGAGLHLLGRDHRRGSRPERARLPPDDVRRGDGPRPVAGRARHRRPAHDAGDPAHGAEGERVGEARRIRRRSTPPTGST